MNADSQQKLAEWHEKIDIPNLLLSLGEDLDREGLQDTPRRVEEAWHELLSGYTIVPEEVVKTTFASEGAGMQVCRNIHFTSMCEHHLLPFSGYVTIGYVPDQRVIGLSKLARLVDCYAKRLQIQERLAEQICATLYEGIEATGVLVIVAARHFCCTGRGVRRDKMDFMTSAIKGKIDGNLYNTLLNTETR